MEKYVEIIDYTMKLLYKLNEVINSFQIITTNKSPSWIPISSWKQKATKH
jgi:hypothetical protein